MNGWRLWGTKMMSSCTVKSDVLGRPKGARAMSKRCQNEIKSKRKTESERNRNEYGIRNLKEIETKTEAKRQLLLKSIKNENDHENGKRKRT